jgi:uncharacterized protein YukE
MRLLETDPGGDLAAVLTALADRVAAVKAELTEAAARVAWTGAAATAFHAHAATRYSALADLVRDLADSATEAKGLPCMLNECAV